MSDSKIVRSIFEKWTAELTSKDRGWDRVLSNFDELFYELYKSSVPAEEAHKLINEAVAKHFPNSSIARLTYDKSPKKKLLSFKEYMDEWKEGINAFAVRSFYAYYTLNQEEPSDEEKKYGNMGVKEYLAQRRYADSFPEVDLVALKKQQAEMQKMLESSEDNDVDPIN